MMQAGFLLLFFYFPKTDEATCLIFIFSKSNKAHLLFILSKTMLIFSFWHLNKMNEGTSFLFKSETRLISGIYNK